MTHPNELPDDSEPPTETHDERPFTPREYKLSTTGYPLSEGERELFFDLTRLTAERDELRVALVRLLEKSVSLRAQLAAAHSSVDSYAGLLAESQLGKRCIQLIADEPYKVSLRTDEMYCWVCGSEIFNEKGHIIHKLDCVHIAAVIWVVSHATPADGAGETKS